MREHRMKEALKVNRPSKDAILDRMVELGLFSRLVTELLYGIEWPMQYVEILGARLGSKLAKEREVVRLLSLPNLWWN